MTPAPIKATADFSDLEKLDIRVGTIIRIEAVPNSRKLACLVVDFGDHQRNILSGIKQERDNLDALVGMQTLFVVNLAPRKMAGMTSEGMLLDIGYADGIQPAFVVPEAPIPNGSRAG